jgi:uncharacterized membrane protein
MSKEINDFKISNLMGNTPKKVLNPEYYQSLLSSKKKLTLGQRAADSLTLWAGSWFFILFLFFLIFVWIYLNLTAYVNHWDPWPFIILNLCLSCLAAIQAPIILMSQNRSAERDRLRSEYDYAVNRKAEREIRDIKKDIENILTLMKNKK